MCELLKFLLRLFDCKSPVRSLSFSKVLTPDGMEIKGLKINMVKFEFNQAAVFTAVPYDRRGNVAAIEAGSAEWTFVGFDADGNDVSDTVTVVVDPANELSATVTSGNVELTGVLTLRADGDPDVGEYFPLLATADIVVDASNAVTFSLSNTTPTDV